MNTETETSNLAEKMEENVPSNRKEPWGVLFDNLLSSALQKHPSKNKAKARKMETEKTRQQMSTQPQSRRQRETQDVHKSLLSS